MAKKSLERERQEKFWDIIHGKIKVDITIKPKKISSRRSTDKTETKPTEVKTKEQLEKERLMILKIAELKTEKENKRIKEEIQARKREKGLDQINFGVRNTLDMRSKKIGMIEITAKTDKDCFAVVARNLDAFNFGVRFQLYKINRYEE